MQRDRPPRPHFNPEADFEELKSSGRPPLSRRLQGRHFHIFGLSFTQHSLFTSVFNLAESISGRSTQQIFAEIFRSMLRITPDATRQIRIFEATYAGAFVREIALDGTVRAAPPAPKHTPRCPTCNIEISSTPVRSRALSAIAAILRDADDAGLIYEVVEPDETDRPVETVPSPRSPSPLPPAVGTLPLEFEADPGLINIPACFRTPSRNEAASLRRWP